MTKVYIGQLKEGFPIIPLLYPNLGTDKKGGRLYLDEAFVDLRDPIVQIVEDIKDADLVLMPYNYFMVKNDISYMRNLSEEAKKNSKKIVVFANGDSSEDVGIENSIIFRTSQYRSQKRVNEIMMPAYVEDLGRSGGVSLRDKSDIPIVGFCGWADFRGVWLGLKYLVKNFMISGAHKQGIYFRRRSIKILKTSLLVKTNFIIRRSYSAHNKTVELDAKKARGEFVNNIIESDFSLAIKGDGNYSNRFYEILSLSRIPVLVDTESIMPLEDVIDYSKFILRIPYQEINNIDKIINDFYGTLSDEEFREMQKTARLAFENHLRIDRFFKYYFDTPERL